MTLRKLILSVSMSLILPSVVGAADIPKPEIKKGFDVTVNSYDPQTDTFLLTINSEPAVGPNYVTSEAFRKAISYEGSKEDFIKQRPQMTGSVYSLKKSLPLLELSELAKLTKKKK